MYGLANLIFALFFFTFLYDWALLTWGVLICFFSFLLKSLRESFVSVYLITFFFLFMIYEYSLAFCAYFWAGLYSLMTSIIFFGYFWIVCSFVWQCGELVENFAFLCIVFIGYLSLFMFFRTLCLKYSFLVNHWWFRCSLIADVICVEDFMPVIMFKSSVTEKLIIFWVLVIKSSVYFEQPICYAV